MNGKPVALLGDETEADGKVNSAASTIKIDEGKPFVFIGPNVHIGKNVSFSVKKPNENKLAEVLEDVGGILLGLGEDGAGILGDEAGIGELAQINGTKRIAKDAMSIEKVIKETLIKKGNFTSEHTLTNEQALEAGNQFLGKNYRELGKPGSGVFRSEDGQRGFRIDDGSLLGEHSPYIPHAHFETFEPGSRYPISNNHVPIIDEE